QHGDVADAGNEADAIASVPSNAIGFDRAAGGYINLHAVAAIAQKVHPGNIRADEVALDQIVMNGRGVGAYLDAKSAIGRDHIARGHIRSANDVEGAVNGHSVQSVPERLGARGVQANQVALNHTIVHAIGYEHAYAAAG